MFGVLNMESSVLFMAFSFARPATLAVAALLGIATVRAADPGKIPEPTREQAHFFEDKIRPVLVERCYKCHSEESGKKKGDLLLDSREGWMKGGEHGTAIVPGDVEKSLVIKAIRYTDPDLQMPPKEKDKLSSKQITDFEEWVKMGAPDPRKKEKAPALVVDSSKKTELFWSFRPVKLPPVPEVKSSKPIINPIDAFVFAKLEEKGLSAAPEADRHTLIRRAYFDLIGLPPTPERVDKFLNDSDPKAYEKLIDELLASKQYGECWGRHWLDVARYADTGGYETDIYYRNAWRYRDYVVNSFNADKPYDIFLQEQVAGDELWPDDLSLAGSYDIPPEKTRHLEARIATGFYTLGTQIHESNMDAKKLENENLTDWVDTTGAAFMGLTVGCARCHDHKFDPISQKDYYGLQAVFAGSKEVEVPLITGMGIADFKQSYPRVLAVEEARRAYRIFEERTKGKQLSEEEKKEKQRLLTNVANELLALPEGTAHDGPYVGLMEVPTASVLGHERAELVPVVHVLNRGEVTRPRDKIEAKLPDVLCEASGWKGSMPGPFGSRKQLALWLTDPRHPLTARVMANRIWYWHFGRGIVATPNDFGKMGEAPTHPELLDWLASEFVKNGWSIKKMHRLMMLSSTYKMDSKFATEENLKKDPVNQYLWRMNRRRLESELLWDALHSVSGTINLKMGGRPVMPPLDRDEMAPGSWIVSADPAEHTRRGIYIMVRRNFRFPMFDVFDSPVNAVSAPTRDTTTVAPQALYFMNNRTTFREAKAFAARLLQEHSDGWNKPDFGENQPGWVGAKAGPHAGWAKRVNNGHRNNYDAPIGSVLTHGPTSVLLRIPKDDPGGTAVVTGSFWNIRHLGRAGDWTLWKNDSEKITEGVVNDSSGSSAKPFDLAKGSKGADALGISYKGGDTLRLEIIEDDFVGINFHVTTPGRIYDIASDFSVENNPTSDGWQYSECLRNGGGIVGRAVTIQRHTEGLASAVERAWKIAVQRPPTEEERKDSLDLIGALAQENESLENPSPALSRLPSGQASALVKFCLALYNLNEFMYID
jgi:hypothetical protein